MSEKYAYLKAIEFIALNDEPTDLDYEQIQGYTTTVLVSEAFGRPVTAIAKAILDIRKAEK